jgi:hypothetical protein
LNRSQTAPMRHLIGQDPNPEGLQNIEIIFKACRTYNIYSQSAKRKSKIDQWAQ